MAPTRPATNDPTPKSAPTTQNNGIKKSSKPTEQQLYVVSRETNDPEGVHDNHEIVGTYKTLAAANAAARDDLIKGWGREYFDEYEANEVDGMVHVVASCPDGEEMVVMVEKSGVRTPAPKAVEQQRYLVLHEANIDDYFEQTEIVGSYENLADANAAARDYLIKVPGREFEVMELDGMVHAKSHGVEEVNVVVRKDTSSLWKVTVPPKAVEQQSYVVLRRSNTDEVKDILGPSEIVGTYKTLADANAAARDYFTKGPGREYFKICEVKEVHGKVQVFSKSHDGYQDVGVFVHKNTASPSKVAAPLNPDAQYTYTVIRETLDPYKGHDNLEILGAYDTLAAANEVARNNMIEKWGRDYFTKFEVSEIRGMVRVNARCPDGEGMYVRVDKAEAKKSSVAEKPAAENVAAGVPEKITVYHVLTHTIDYHHDPDGGMQDTAIVGTYLSLTKANETAREYLAKDWDMDFFEEYDESVHNGMVAIKAICAEGEEMNVYVEKGKLFTDGEGLREVEEELEYSLSESDGEGFREMEEVSDDE